MKIEVEKDSRASILRPEGEIDLHFAPQLRDSMLDLIGAGRPPILVDLGHVVYMDSSALATLVEGLRRARDAEQLFVLAGMQAAPRRVMELTRLDQVFTVYPDCAAALDALPLAEEGA